MGCHWEEYPCFVKLAKLLHGRLKSSSPGSTKSEEPSWRHCDDTRATSSLQRASCLKLAAQEEAVNILTDNPHFEGLFSDVVTLVIF